MNQWPEYVTCCADLVNQFHASRPADVSRVLHDLLDLPVSSGTVELRQTTFPLQVLPASGTTALAITLQNRFDVPPLRFACALPA